MKPEIIIALDFPTGKKALSFLDLFEGEQLYVKVGMELFYSEGPSIVRAIKAGGHKVFLDLKLHDIPNTVKSSMKVLASVGADMVNVHAAGGIRMMKAAVEGLEDGSTGAARPEIIAVTQLTSTDQETMNSELKINGELRDVVLAYARNAQEAGLDGVVCSAWESEEIHAGTSDSFITVTPGIRLLGDAKGDQSRVATPARAKEMGSDYLVIGRSITKADDPVKAYRICMEEINND
ncbi:MULTISPECIES: orotidine-5'-phosphate decarboxylase [Mogibacterium]|jgi:orotidine 5'-phosphate decarboxylase|uniref:Orotidine 5'-phosphate decarboxylase n=2 Tax=Mogibacterium timidum TaxID=35519 RepID=X8J7L0_9FIRM|nr:MULTISPECIES: orotidine-5'-phosphate decarboxylase [Mogibacterium]EJU20690.1 orotidine 5'-phosphate decarboxylase [Mogibacterium sp. CM50]EUC57922.1 orotidine 5'-phosphate decarboxylase [Mogibacterium timidum ATCC 33093]NWO23748.1 orotidine-5'-phosphate decarboxylase [Mogibacterium timidum]